MIKHSLNLSLFLITQASLMIIADVQATEIYRYVDAKGQIHFTDTPPQQSSRPAKNMQQAELTSVRIYKFVDETGVIHFSDQPRDKRYQLIYQGNLFAGKSYSGSSGKSSGSTQPHRKAEDYDSTVREIASTTGLEPALIHAIIHAESAYNPNAVSPKGAVGMMQLMPGTARRYGVDDSKDATENISGGARYMRDLLQMFNNDKELAVAAYNAGENAVIRYGNSIPPYRETQNYVRRVLDLYENYKQQN